ncbi:MAG: hypothetical protein ACLTSZ_02340 [Lachnospiraceae bacterium]
MIRDEVIAEGIRSTRWQGRMETVLPGVVLDGAHNADGIKEFIRTVVGVQEHRSVSLLFSAVVEKEYEKMIAEIWRECTSDLHCRDTDRRCTCRSGGGTLRRIPEVYGR